MSETTTTKPDVSKHCTSSILLRMPTDKPRQAGMDRWKGPHSGIISAAPGLFEYRQIHLAEHNPGRWPATRDIETIIPEDRRIDWIDWIAEVTFENALSPLAGRKQTALAFEDEGTVGFHKFLKKELTPALIATGELKELRTQVFLPWNEKTWDTPNVAHDNPEDQHLHASVILGFADGTARDAFYTTHAGHLTELLAPHASAIHAYDVETTLTYVKESEILSHSAD
ncbi:strictosidine synthase [Saxibacter everestensis]|uniref:Strictosidine synthase n=1 Tax=Saxibacter everestensis TaxID=2909229 RepID=A0ABY8QQG9_9MICO|nr:strictosidine synthase [Brevibacteriaceae bacterium ZFBP1038]